MFPRDLSEHDFHTNHVLISRVHAEYNHSLTTVVSDG